MKLAVRALLFPIILLVSFLAESTHAKQAHNPPHLLKISVVDSWPPYIYIDENNQLAGQDYELLKSVLEEMNYGLKLVSNVSDNRRFYALGHALHEVVVGAFVNEERAEVSRFSIPYRSEKMGLFYTDPDLFKGEKLELEEKFDLKPVVGVMNLAAWAGEAFEELKISYPENILHIESQYSRLKMLELGRVDFTIGDTVSIEQRAKELKITNFILHPDIIFEANIHFAFSKKAVDEAFMRKFNIVLSRKLAEQNIEAF